MQYKVVAESYRILLPQLEYEVSTYLVIIDDDPTHLEIELVTYIGV